MTATSQWLHDAAPVLYGVLFASVLFSIGVGYFFSAYEALRFLPREDARKVIHYAARHQALVLSVTIALMLLFVWFRPDTVSEGLVFSASTVVAGLLAKWASINTKVHKQIVMPYLEAKNTEATRKRDESAQRLEEAKRKYTDPPD